jgi:hypothetical protein
MTRLPKSAQKRGHSKPKPITITKPQRTKAQKGPQLLISKAPLSPHITHSVEEEVRGWIRELVVPALLEQFLKEKSVAK